MNRNQNFLLPIISNSILGTTTEKSVDTLRKEVKDFISKTINNTDASPFNTQNNQRNRNHFTSKIEQTSNNTFISNPIEIKLKKNTNELYQKKVIKGKLFKLINNCSLEHKEEEEIKMIPFAERKKVNAFVVPFYPNCIGKDVVYSKRSKDIMITPEELIFKNFTEEEIDIIKSNANYFKLNNDDTFKTMDVFRNRKLIEILEEEDRENKSQTKTKKRKNQYLTNMEIKEILKKKELRNRGESSEFLSYDYFDTQPKKKEDEDIDFKKFEREHKKKYKSHRFGYQNDLRREINEETIKKKFEKFNNKRKEIMMKIQDDFKKKLERNNYIRMHAERKKKEEIEDKILINKYNQLIKDNYTTKK